MAVGAVRGLAGDGDGTHRGRGGGRQEHFLLVAAPSASCQRRVAVQVHRRLMCSPCGCCFKLRLVTAASPSEESDPCFSTLVLIFDFAFS